MEPSVELNTPLAGQRDHAQRSQPRPERRHREVWKAEEPGHRGKVRDHRVDLFGADHRDRDDGRTRPDRGGDKASTTKAPQAVAILKVFPGPSNAFRKDEHELVALEQSARVVGMANRLTRPTQEPAEHRHAHEKTR